MHGLSTSSMETSVQLQSGVSSSSPDENVDTSSRSNIIASASHAQASGDMSRRSSTSSCTPQSSYTTTQTSIFTAENERDDTSTTYTLSHQHILSVSGSTMNIVEELSPIDKRKLDIMIQKSKEMSDEQKRQKV